MSDKLNTYTFTKTNNCLHETYTFRKVRINLCLFELSMIFKVCHKCHELIKDHNKWIIKLN